MTPTGLGPLVERIEALERRFTRLADDVAESQDTVVRRLDKYRKRIEREESEQGAPELGPQERGVDPRNGATRGDVLAIRRGPSTFPGRGR